MTLRRQWYETEEWARMETSLFFHGIPMRLPDAEFDAFQSKFFSRLSTIRKVLRSPLVNHPDVKLLWWMWLNLDPEQKQFMIELDSDGVIQYVATHMAWHGGVLDEMLDPKTRMFYWATDAYVQLVHGITPKCIVKLPRDTALALMNEYHNCPKSARYRNLAINYDGGNVDDVMTYLGDGYRLVSNTPERLIIEAPKGNAQILKDQWIWFNKDGLKHGNLKTFVQFRATVPDQRDAPGFWTKPGVTTLEAKRVMRSNLCPEITNA